ncbi:hypothetical protein V5O48_001516 [Marasmius crinis-equi]|uniref:Uncharacterized protein n=1 Tax=Marasmius crinis-equi TaxID=585013 RepID=A0ABR3FYA5_9AGAR
MTASSQNASPFSRFSRAFGLSNKSNTSPSRNKPRYTPAKVREPDEDWYIPYNGPYEPPKPVIRRERERDSWGDPIDGEEDDPEDHILVDPELHNRYGTQPSSSYDWRGGEGNGSRQGRARTQSGGSVFSGRTVSSGTVDPGRSSIGAPRRSTVSGSNRPPPLPSYGGIGDSPVLPRASSSITPRKSLGSLFTFASSNKKKTTPSPSLKHSPDMNRQVGTSAVHITQNPEQPSARINPPEAEMRPISITRLPSDPNLAADALRKSGAANDEDYYNSYYSTLLNMSADNQTHQPTTAGASDPSSFHTRQPSHIPEPYSPASDASSAPHPYAYQFPTFQLPPDPPQSAPPMQKTHFLTAPKPHEHPLVTPTASPVPRHLAQNALKNSISTPNLRGNTQTPSSQPRKNFKERLLSAETWCDALLFPRPRLKARRDGTSGASTPSHGSGRIVSPPASPVLDYFGNRMAAEGGIASRVLAHSRSLVDLHTAPVAGPSRVEEPPVPVPLPEARRLQERKPADLPQLDPPPARPPRPKSWALDDLVLPSPVPSLARVLEEGQILEHQRKKWQTQAINSFQNERARSLSRSRSKSQRGKKRSEKINNFEYLAARGLLGNQEPVAVHLPSARRPRTASETESRGTIWTSSHAHSNSLTKTLTKTSKSHSRDHSRSDSIGKSALRVAKSTAKTTAALCGFDGGGIIITPVDEKSTDQNATNHGAGLDGAIRAPGTRVIRLQDPAQIQAPITPITPLDSYRVSPTPSALTDTRVGIAISTPPLTDEAVDREAIRLPAHPYAQGGLTVSLPQSSSHTPKGTDHEMSALSPTRDSPSTHPYALVSASPSSDSYSGEGRIIKEVRPESLVPAPEKMWAQWGSGVVKEILPSDLRYSPFVTVEHFDDRGGDEKVDVRRAMRNSSPIYDTAGIGETLAWAVHRQSRDSGLGGSEEQGSFTNFVGTSQVIPEKEEIGLGIAPIAVSEKPDMRYRDSVRRIPVQYDASRPAHLHHVQKASITSLSPPLASTSIASPSRPSRTELEAASASPSKLVVPTRNDSTSSSPGGSSSSSSPPMSPPLLGNPDDLEKYHDLFYRPRGMSVDSTTQPLNPRSPIRQPSNIPWDVRSQGTGRTGLTSIVRQLSEELDDTHDDQLRRSLSLSSRSSLSALRQSAYATGRSPPTDTSLRFVFSDIPETASVDAVSRVKPVGGDQDAHGAFFPSGQIPEDIETSTRASSPTSAIDDETLKVYRLGHVETNSTPIAEASDPRLSFVGQMSYAHGDMDEDEQDDVLGSSPGFARHPATAHSSLQPPSADPTRSSYMTSNSESSRMSVSDFPAPPPQHLTPAHMSLLSSYFDETMTASELAEVQARSVHTKPGTRSRAGSVSATLATLGRSGANSPVDKQTLEGDKQERDQSFDDNNQVIDELLAKLSPTTASSA